MHKQSPTTGQIKPSSLDMKTRYPWLTITTPTLGQAYIRYPGIGGVALAPQPLLTRLLTRILLIVVNWGMLYLMISEC